MNRSERYPAWSLWILEHGWWILITVALLGSILAAGYYFGDLGDRLSRLESRLDFIPPASYQAPNLDDYRADISPEQLNVGGSVYVPVYSHIYYEGGAPCLLETTLSIRNTSRTDNVFLQSVDYYETDGKLAKSYLDRLIRLRPLETIEFLIPRTDGVGGSGANFLVDWRAPQETSAPFMETVMIGAVGTRGISFTCQGVPVQTNRTDDPDQQP